jgi:aminoglycoside phosphotransferase (APT) family kinase protein
MQAFFTLKDDFNSIIGRIIPADKIRLLRHIATGWTNIVIEVTTGEEAYFFRFPRNDFFAKMMLKDFAFCTFIRGKTSFKTPYLELFRDQGRVFSMHRKIRGWCLTERMRHLSRQIMMNIAYDISHFICELSSISPEMLPADCSMRLSDFLDELADVDDDYYDKRQHDVIRRLEAEPCVVHGDFNPGNIILDDDNRVSGVIDFCFSGVSGKHTDLGRLIGRSDPQFRPVMIKAIEETSGERVDINAVDATIDVFNYVEQEYISYMRVNQPEIVLPPEMQGTVPPKKY